MNRLTKCLMSHEGALFPREVHPIQGPLLFSMQPRRVRGSLLQSSEMSGAGAPPFLPSTFPPSPETFSLDNLPPFPLVPLPHSRALKFSDGASLSSFYGSDEGDCVICKDFILVVLIIHSLCLNQLSTIYQISDPQIMSHINHGYRQYRNGARLLVRGLVKRPGKARPDRLSNSTLEFHQTRYQKPCAIT